MATRDQIMEGIRRADAAGDSASVRRLGEYLKSMPAEASVPASKQDSESPGYLSSLGAGAGAEFGKIVLGGQKLLGKGINVVDEMVNGKSVSSLVTGKPTSTLGRAGNWLIEDAEQGQAKLQSQNAPYADANPITNRIGQVAADMVATAPVGGLVSKGVRIAAPSVAATRTGANLLRAVETSGAQGGNLLSRSTGAAITGGASAAVVDPESAWTGAVIGGLTPGFFRAAGMTGDAVASLVRPLFARGQQRIVADILRQHVDDPRAAVAALRQATEIVPGSTPITAAAVGDPRMSGLTRTMQNASPDFAAELAQRQTAQNNARTNLLQDVAGTPGSLTVAREARDQATAGMRESVLGRAQDISAPHLLQRLDQMLRDPNNAGQTAQAALRRMREQVAGASQNGTINARALYEIRKDAGLAMNGRLQGDAGNLRYARGQLDRVQSLFDDAIETASQQPVSNSTRIGIGGSKLTTEAQASAMREADQAAQPQTSWRAYLNRYSEMSRPINQMDSLQDIMRRVQTGATDAQGNPIISAAKLNNILKNEGQELSRSLTREQLQTLRNLAADLNASQLAMNSGRSVGSNTVQNLAGDQLLNALLGRFGSSTPARTTLGNALRIPYARANDEIRGRLGNALLNPSDAATLIEQATAPVNMLSVIPRPAASLAYRTPPLLLATGQ